MAVLSRACRVALHALLGNTATPGRPSKCASQITSINVTALDLKAHEVFAPNDAPRINCTYIRNHSLAGAIRIYPRTVM